MLKWTNFFPIIGTSRFVVRTYFFQISLGNFFLILNKINMPMTMHFTKYVATLTLLSKIWECRPKNYLNGLRIINCKTSQISVFWYWRKFKWNLNCKKILIKGSCFGELLGVKFDHKLTLNQPFKSLCKKANTKLKVFSSVVPYMRLGRKKKDKCVFLQHNSVIVH